MRRRDDRNGNHLDGHPKRRWSIWKVILLGLLGTVAGIAIYLGATVNRLMHDISIAPPPPVAQPGEIIAPEAVPAPTKKDGRVNILAMGLDDDALRSDAMLLISLDTQHNKVGVIQIPRDTRALLAGKGTYEKINAAYAYGVGDPRFPAHLRALKTVEDLLGVEVHHTVVIELEGFRRIVDEVGGVELDIPFRMYYDDPEQDLHIHFEPGKQLLGGKQALEFVRWRNNNDGSGNPDGDLGRIRMQQQFLRALLGEMFSIGNLPLLPSQAVKVAKHVETTLEAKEIFNLAVAVAKVNPKNIEMVTLPGTDAYLLDPYFGQRLSYYVHDPARTSEVVDRLVRGAP